MAGCTKPDLAWRSRRDRAELTGKKRATGFECAGHSEKMSDGAWLGPLQTLSTYT